MTETSLSKQQSKGAVALIVMIFMTGIILVVGVGLGIMNLDYTLSGASDLAGRGLSTASEGCLEAGLTELRNNNGITSMNVNNIGTNVNCVVSVQSNGNLRYVTARATSTSDFLNSVSIASSTVNVATNPFTIIQQSQGHDPRTNVFAQAANVNVGSSSGWYATVAVHGDYAYVSYRDEASSNKLSIARVDLKTFTVGTTLQNVSSTAVNYMDSLVLGGDLYVSYYAQTGVVGTDGPLAVARVDLDNFTAGGVTLLEGLSGACGSAGCVTFANSITSQGSDIFIAYRHPAAGSVFLKTVDTAVFASTTDAVSTLQVTTGYGSHPDAVASGDYVYILTFDSNSGAPTLFKINITSNSIDSRVNLDPLQATTHHALVVVDNFAYAMWDDFTTSRNITIGKIATNNLQSVSTTTTSYEASYLSADTANGYIYISSNNMPDNTDVNLYKVNIANLNDISALTNFTSGDLYERPQVVAPGGQYVYSAFYDRGAARARLYKFKVD